MKTLRSITFTIVLLLGSSSAMADPIQDNIYFVYKAGWFPSDSIPCPIVCKKADGAPAEGEILSVPKLQNRATYVCKSPVAVSGKIKMRGTLYGNNFSTPSRNKLCMVSTPNGSTWRQKRFYCLCVFK